MKQSSSRESSFMEPDDSSESHTDPMVYRNCLFCHCQLPCLRHSCTQCGHYDVLPVYDRSHLLRLNPTVYSECQCEDNSIMYETPCGIIYNGYSQCPCPTCCNYLGSIQFSSTSSSLSSIQDSCVSDPQPRIYIENMNTPTCKDSITTRSYIGVNTRSVNLSSITTRSNTKRTRV